MANKYRKAPAGSPPILQSAHSTSGHHTTPVRRPDHCHRLRLRGACRTKNHGSEGKRRSQALVSALHEISQTHHKTLNSRMIEDHCFCTLVLTMWMLHALRFRHAAHIQCVQEGLVGASHSATMTGETGVPVHGQTSACVLLYPVEELPHFASV